MKILANDGISEDAKSMLASAGHEVSTDKVTQEELARYIKQEKYDVLIVRSATQVDEKVLDCPSLKIVARAGVGLDNIDTYYAEKKGIKVINTPAASSQSVAELVMGMMFSLSRSLHDSAKNMSIDDFSTLKKKYSNGVELRGKVLGIIGFGRIGQSLAGYALGIGMDVLAVDLVSKTVEITCKIGRYDVTVDVGVTSRMEDILPICDFISVHVPKHPNGDSVITSKEIEMMKQDVVLINAARGGVIEESALLDAVDKGRIRAAALDVFEKEPNPRPALLVNPKLLTTPHIGAATVDAQDRIGYELAESLIRELEEVSL